MVIVSYIPISNFKMPNTLIGTILFGVLVAVGLYLQYNKREEDFYCGKGWNKKNKKRSKK